MVTEFAESSLLELLAQDNNSQGLEKDTVLMLFMQTCLGLDYLHQRDSLHIVSKDFNAGSFLLTQDGVLKIANFGTSPNDTFMKIPDERMDSVKGDGNSARGNLIEGNDLDSSNKVDIWRLGVLLYHLATGSTEFEGE